MADTKSAESRTLSQDIRSSVRITTIPLLKYILEKYVFIPVGTLLVLCLLYGINEIIKKTTINFPASVCLMLILYAVLCISTLIVNEEFTRKYILRFLEYPCGFALRWINLYFTPAFVTLPLAEKVSVGEAFTIVAIFIIGYLVMFAFIGYLCWGLEIVMGIYPKEEDEEVNDIEKNGHIDLESDRATVKEGFHLTESVTADDRTSDEQSQISSNNNNSIEGVSIEDRDDEAYALYALATNTELSRAITRSTTRHTEVSFRVTEPEVVDETESRDVQISNFFLKWFDWFVYSVVFIVGIPIYFTTGYELPLQLGVAVILFKNCMLLSAKTRKYFHPILVSFSLSLLIFYIFTLIKKQSFLGTIRDYKTGRTYLYLFDSKEYPRWPGAGDFLLSLMDVSIVSLSLAMYNYRKDLKRYFGVIIIPVIVSSFMSFFIYPPLCYHLGINASRSLGFTGRSVTMALGVPLVNAIGGNQQLMAATTIMSGIIGALCGDILIFKGLRVRRRDFVTRGVTLGINCGAVSTAHLLSIDPRAAAMSSLGFTLFGTLMVILSAINPLVRVIQGLVGL